MGNVNLIQIENPGFSAFVSFALNCISGISNVFLFNTISASTGHLK